MYLKLARAAVSIAAISAVAAAGLGSAQAKPVASKSSVVCNTGALIAAITGASSGDTLFLATNCTYKLTAALPDITKNLTIYGHKSTIERSYAPATPSFTILTVEADVSLALNNVDFRNGGGPDVDEGGAIFNDGTTTITSGTFTGNTSDEYGGAIYNNDGLLTVSDAYFTGNSGEYGGAIYNDSTASISNTTFDGNTATEDGGAVNNDDSITLTGVDFRHNAGLDGGGFYNGDDGTTVSNSIFRLNHATDGGAIYSDSTLSIDHTLITFNFASSDGGGIYNDGTLTIDHGLITLNTALSGGGGIFNDESNVVTLTNTAVFLNAPDNCEPTGTITGCTN